VACGYATCAEFLDHTKTLRSQSAELEFTGPVCNLRDIDLGIAVDSAAKTAAIHSIDCRCQARVAVAARKLDLIQADGGHHRVPAAWHLGTSICRLSRVWPFLLILKEP
jgi:uncharacterized ferredoxin-like protein